MTAQPPDGEGEARSGDFARGLLEGMAGYPWKFDDLNADWVRAIDAYEAAIRADVEARLLDARDASYMDGFTAATELMTRQRDALAEALRVVRDYDPDKAPGRGGIAELMFDEFAYRRLVESYRDHATIALATLDAESNQEGS